MKTLLRRLSLDLLGALVIGGVLSLFFPLAVGILAGVGVLVFMARPSIREYRSKEALPAAD